MNACCRSATSPRGRNPRSRPSAYQRDAVAGRRRRPCGTARSLRAIARLWRSALTARSRCADRAARRRGSTRLVVRGVEQLPRVARRSRAHAAAGAERSPSARPAASDASTARRGRSPGFVRIVGLSVVWGSPLVAISLTIEPSAAEGQLEPSGRRSWPTAVDRPRHGPYAAETHRRDYGVVDERAGISRPRSQADRGHHVPPARLLGAHRPGDPIGQATRTARGPSGCTRSRTWPRCR